MPVELEFRKTPGQKFVIGGLRVRFLSLAPTRRGCIISLTRAAFPGFGGPAGHLGCLPTRTAACAGCRALGERPYRKRPPAPRGPCDTAPPPQAPPAPRGALRYSPSFRLRRCDRLASGNGGASPRAAHRATAPTAGRRLPVPHASPRMTHETTGGPACRATSRSSSSSWSNPTC